MLLGYSAAVFKYSSNHIPGPAKELPIDIFAKFIAKLNQVSKSFMLHAPTLMF